MRATRLNFENPIKDSVTRLRFAPTSNHLLISSWDSHIRLYDVDNNELKLEAETQSGLLDCCFESGSFAYSAGSDGSICRHDLHSGAYATIGRHEDVATCVEYSDETCQTITSGWDGKILSWDSRKENAIQCLTGYTSHVESISVHRFELLVATGSSVCKYDLRKMDQTMKKVFETGISIKCVRSSFCWDGFAVGSVDGRVSLQSNFDETGFTFRCHPKSEKGHLASVNDIIFNPSVQGAIVTGDNEGYVIAWDSRSKKRLLELPRFPNSVASLSYNHTGEMVAIASSHTYQEANEKENDAEIFIQEMGESHLKAAAAGSSSSRKRE